MYKHKRLKIPVHFRSNAPTETAVPTSDTLLFFSYANVVLSLLPYLHLASNEFVSSSSPVFENCLPYKSQLPGKAVFFLSLLVWIWALQFVLNPPQSENRILNWTRASFFIYWGAFLNMSIKPKEWFLSFEQAPCYENFGHAAVGRVATCSYALLFAGAVDTYSLVPCDGGSKSRLYLVGLLLAHLAVVAGTCSLILA